MAVTLMLDISPSAAALLRPVALVSMGIGLTLSCIAGWRYTLALAGKSA
jgi:hypothetical protein